MSSTPTGDPSPNTIERIRVMANHAPQARALGLELIAIEGRKVRGRAPYRAEFVGDPATGVIAGGIITTFLDQLCGMATMLALPEPTMIATIDLRIDYMRPAEPSRDVLAEAYCYKIGRSVAFVRAVAFEDAPESPIAHATATFMVSPPRNAAFVLPEVKP